MATPPETTARSESGLLRRLMGATGLFALAILLSRVLGLLREMLVASRFGAGVEMDRFSVAQNLPFRVATAAQTLTMGAMVPVVAAYLREDRERDARLVGGTVLTFVASVALLASGLGMLLSQPAVSILAPGYGPDALAPTAALLRLLSPYLLVAGAGGVLACVVLARQRFVAPALAHVAPNVLILIVLVLLEPRLGIGALALGTTLGGVAYLLALLPAALRIVPWRELLAWSPRHPGVGRVGALALPLLIPALGVPLVATYDRMLLSGHEAGQIASLGYAENLVLLPLGLLISSLGTVLLPILSWDAADGEQLARRTSIAVRLSLMALVLTVAVLYGTGRLSVITLYGLGRFDAQAVQSTSSVLAWLSPMALGDGLSEVLTRSYHATQDTLTPTILWVVAHLARVGVATVAAPRMGARGVALAHALASLLQAALLGGVLQRRLVRPIWPEVARVGLATVLSGAVVVLGLTQTARAFPIMFEGGRLVAAGWLLTLLVVATLIYGALVLATSPRERAAILARAGRALGRGPQAPDQTTGGSADD